MATPSRGPAPPGAPAPAPGDPVPILQDLLRSAVDPTCQATVEAVKARCKGWRKVEGEGFLWVQPGPRAGLVLSAHLDVVPPGPREAWRHDPFGGEVAEGQVWGRGACDMLGAVAAMLAAVERAGTGDWALALTTDEETGMRGAHNLVKGGALEGADLVVVGEPTAMDLGVAHKGVLWTQVATQGKAAHGSRPEEGVNAIAAMLTLLRGLEGFALPQRHPLFGGSSLNVGTIRGGEATNVVPARCEAALDLRIPPPGTTATARKALEAALQETGVPHTVEVTNAHEPFQARGGRLLDRVRAWLREAHPQAREVGLPYGTEASLYQAQAPCVIVGPGSLDHMHVPDERVPVAELRAATRFYTTLLRAWAG